MATTGPFNGTSVLLYAAGTAIAYSTSCSVSMSTATIDVSSKADSGYKNILPGQRNWTADVEGMVALDSSVSAPYLTGLWTGRTRVMLKFSTNTSGDDYWHGYCYLTSLSIAAPLEDKVTFSASFEGDETLTCSAKT